MNEEKGNARRCSKNRMKAEGTERIRRKDEGRRHIKNQKAEGTERIRRKEKLRKKRSFGDLTGLA